MENVPAIAPELPAPRARGRLLKPLGSAQFRKLWIANNLSLVGDFFSYVALAWLVLQLTGSSLALGGVLVAQAVPRSVLMAVGGAFSDRLSARVTMLGSMGLRVAVVGPLAILVLSGRVQMWEVYTASAVFGVVDAFFIPARSSILPRRSEEHTSELQSLAYLVCRLLLEKKKKIKTNERKMTTNRRSPLIKITTLTAVILS